MECETLTSEQFEDFSTLIHRHLGIRMPPTKRVMLQSRLHRRMRELGLESIAEYHDRFFHQPEHQSGELEHLLNLATTNKTEFFREADHFDFLAQTVLPWWRRERPASQFRIWCAGCSTGEEAYTLAMVLLEQQAVERFDFSILATDVSTRVLRIAHEAVYAEDRIGPIPPPWRVKYLLRSRDASDRVVRIAPEVRGHVRFGHLNFLAPAYGVPDPIDAVFFRNVMIYFDRTTQQEVVGRICRHLRPDGFLFTAHAESLQGLALPLRSSGTAVYRHTPGLTA